MYTIKKNPNNLKFIVQCSMVFTFVIFVIHIKLQQQTIFKGRIINLVFFNELPKSNKWFILILINTTLN